MEKDKFDLACDVYCGVRFDSNGFFCKECEEYNEALARKGKTKSIHDYQVEATMEQGKMIQKQLKDDEYVIVAKQKRNDNNDG